MKILRDNESTFQMVRFHIGASVSGGVPRVKAHVIHDYPVFGDTSTDKVIFHRQRFVGASFVNTTAH
jgi:hypothetical protein